jgi:hypothetical protein
MPTPSSSPPVTRTCWPPCSAPASCCNRRALTGAAASAVPLPGVDWLVDAALLSKLMPAISAEFGLTPQQLERLPRASASRCRRPCAWSARW